ncbi:MAG TPA: ribonuclease H-like domain-containing protein [Candidatus Paceibacterota bacterium]|nr:ribonuclease H-like domain-containing protein [Candidatus Paceibacterota bacterium]
MRFVVFDLETKMSPFSRGRLDVRELELTVAGVYDSTEDAYRAYTLEELPRLWPLLERAELLIGFNSDSFDIPLLNRYYPGDLSSIRSLDLLTEVYRALGRRLRLDNLARATLGRGKKGDGAKAGAWWEAGLYDKVKEYCLEDVRLTKELYDYALAHGALKYKDLSATKDIKLDTRHWLAESAAPAMTHALPL